MQTVTILRCGESRRLERVLAGLPLQDVITVPAAEFERCDLRGSRVLFCIALDECGEDERVCRLLRAMRARPGCLEGCVGAAIVDGRTEYDTKDVARRLILAANRAGCAFPGKPLVEATGSLRNLGVLRRKLALPDLMATYEAAAAALLERLCEPPAPRSAQPRLLVLHASEHTTSNTLALSELVTRKLHGIEVETLSLRNGTILDCRGCSFSVCAHYATQGGCFYGGTIAEQVLPAVLRADALLLLCPNYNDAVGANISAFINRLTSLTVSNALYGKALFAIVVSGYSGSDLVAQQLLGALCLNKAFSLPPRFCLMQTANDPGEVLRQPGIQAQAEAFAAQIREVLCKEKELGNSEDLR